MNIYEKLHIESLLREYLDDSGVNIDGLCVIMKKRLDRASLQGSIIINERDIPRDMEESVSDMKIWAKDFWDSDQVLVNNYDYKNIMKFMNFILEEHFMNKKQKALEDFERFLRETKAKRMIIDQGNIEFPEGDDSYKIGDNYLDTETIETIRAALSRPSVDVDTLANFIRTINGNNDMGAGELAENIHDKYVVGEKNV